jgi:hypothetical protein
MRPKVIIVAAAGLFAATAAQACPACGDKLSLVGGGVSFERVSHVGPPGRIVVLAAPGSPLQAADKDLGLVAGFKRAGHEVTVVADEADLARVVNEQHTDVVLAHWSEAKTAAGQLGSESTSPTVVAVTYKTEDAEAAKAAGVGDCVCRADQRKGRKLSDKVDQILELRRKGQPADCAVTIASRTN